MIPNQEESVPVYHRESLGIQGNNQIPVLSEVETGKILKHLSLQKDEKATLVQPKPDQKGLEWHDGVHEFFD